MKAYRFALTVAGLSLLAVTPAWAQDASGVVSETDAEAAFRDGRRLMEAERYAEACEKLALSQRLDPGVGTLTNLGICYEKLGKFATAWERLNEAVDLAQGAEQSERAEKIRAYAKTLEPRLTRLLIQFTGERPAGLKVSRGSEDVTQSLGSAVPVDPGSYVSGRARVKELSVEAVGGYKWHPTPMGFYVQPWIGISRALYRKGLSGYKVPPVGLFASVNLGFELAL